MTSHQKRLLAEAVFVLAATGAIVVGMMNLRDYVNRSEAMRAVNQLGARVLEYRKTRGSLPSQSYVDSIKDQLEGSVRMGSVRYRALYIGLDAPDETILAYSRKRHPSSFLKDGYVVLHLDGRVEWMPTRQFADLFATQQAPAEPPLPER